MMRIFRRLRVCLYKKRKRAGKTPAPKSIYEKALQRIGEEYPKLRKDSFLWLRLRRVVGHVANRLARGPAARRFPAPG